MLDAHDKLTPWERLRGELGLAAAACAHIGDDLPDIPLLARLRARRDRSARTRCGARARALRDAGAKAAAARCASSPTLILAAQGRGDDSELRDAQRQPPLELAREER